MYLPVNQKIPHFAGHAYMVDRRTFSIWSLDENKNFLS